VCLLPLPEEKDAKPKSAHTLFSLFGENTFASNNQKPKKNQPKPHSLTNGSFGLQIDEDRSEVR
jgi:hypothetical protein